MKPSVGNCRSCGKKIMWVQTQAGRAMPLDAEPSDRGNLVLEVDGDKVLNVHPGELVSGYGIQRYVSHFATCSHAGVHRRKA